MNTRLLIPLTLLGIMLASAACGSTETAPSGGEAVNLSPAATGVAEPVVNADTPTGKLIFIQLPQGVGSAVTTLVQYDLATGETTPLFTPPDNGLLLSADVSAGGSQIVMAYAPPPPEGQIQFGYTGLYLLPLGSADTPQLLLEKQMADEIFFHPVWSPDGAVYFAHMGPEDDSTASFFVVTLERLDMGTGETAVIAQDGIWPRVAPDGGALAYAYAEPTTQNNELYVVGKDGSNPLRLTALDDFLAVDSPIFSPDGRYVYFSAVTEDTMVPQTVWWERLLGVRTALAHNIPSDWWRIPADGSGPAERLTEIREIGLFGDFSPDGRYFAFISATSLYIMEPDGNNLNQVLETAVVGGALAWIP